MSQYNYLVAILKAALEGPDPTMINELNLVADLFSDTPTGMRSVYDDAVIVFSKRGLFSVVANISKEPTVVGGYWNRAPEFSCHSKGLSV